MTFRSRSSRAIARGWLFALPLVAALEGESAAASKDECLEAHGRAQDLREKGQLARAKQMFMTCAQSSCPALVQGDCARNSDELSHLLPSVTFTARDATANDLPNTTVYVDDVLVTTRLDDGRSYELDPGKHTLRYVHEGKETTLKVVLNQGEKGRVLIATFVGTPSPLEPEISGPVVSSPKRPSFPLVVAGLGGAAAIAGGLLLGIGLAGVPDRCSISTRECAGPPNDPALEDARSSVSLANAGTAIAVGGAVMLAGGLLWYFLQPPSDTRTGRLPLGSGPLISF
ncbi:MAG: hypothetical protein KF819_35570 [Labilithrix sp.]|nr:hypothetical protein [Labilithrix sp.]